MVLEPAIAPAFDSLQQRKGKRMSYFKEKSGIFLAVVGAVAGLAMIASCGRENDGANPYSELNDWKAQPKDQLFSSAEIASVYSTATENREGKSFPASKPPLRSLYTYANAPDAFKAEYGQFTAGAEIKGYLSLGYWPVSGFQQRYLSNFEKISTWRTILDSKGETIFADANTTDERGRKIPDWSDGYASENGEIHFANLSLKTNTPLGAFPVPCTVSLYNRDGEMQVDVTNPKDVKVPLVGTVIKAQGLKIHLKAFPYEKGWLVYGSTTVKLEKFEDAIKPEVLSQYVDSLFNWVKNNTIMALPQ
jgi:hypothetical protein